MSGLNKKLHAMLDIETLGIKPGYVVHEVAIAIFDAETFAMIDHLHVCIDIDDSKSSGLMIDQTTLGWWAGKGGPRQKLIDGKQAQSLKTALQMVTGCLHYHKPANLWSRGKDFDFPMMEHLFHLARIAQPWEYWQLRCVRDLHSLAFPEHPRPSSSHDALEDCKQQIGDLKAACQKLNLSLVSGVQSEPAPSIAQDKTAAILEDRAKTHGTFSQVAEIAQLIKNVVRDETTALDACQQEAIDMIASKLARICSGNPDEPDHWRDIAGYATLVADGLDAAESNQEVAE